MRGEFLGLCADIVSLPPQPEKAPRKYSRHWKKLPSSAAGRIGTGEMNRFLKHVDSSAPRFRRQQVRIYYMTAGAVAPSDFASSSPIAK